MMARQPTQMNLNCQNVNNKSKKIILFITVLQSFKDISDETYLFKNKITSTLWSYPFRI